MLNLNQYSENFVKMAEYYKSVKINYSNVSEDVKHVTYSIGKCFTYLHHN